MSGGFRYRLPAPGAPCSKRMTVLQLMQIGASCSSWRLLAIPHGSWRSQTAPGDGPGCSWLHLVVPQLHQGFEYTLFLHMQFMQHFLIHWSYSRESYCMLCMLRHLCSHGRHEMPRRHWPSDEVLVVIFDAGHRNVGSSAAASAVEVEGHVLEGHALNALHSARVA